ncbi:MAG: transporter substrate-binding domain-containing protein [Hyphomicrobiaceae bacterium]|nr:transporter substrate-binding domain-containing protein [Hyphomicrobiaceae bacterium]
MFSALTRSASTRLGGLRHLGASSGGKTSVLAVTHRAGACAGVVAAFVAVLLTALAAAPALAQANDGAAASKRAVLRFLTDSDYPPFHYFDQDGTLTGFNVEMARAICREMETTCDIRNRPWAELLPALKKGDADAVIASFAVTPRLIKDFDVTDRYYHTPARFAGKTALALADVTPETIEGRRIAVTKGTAHEAYLRAFFTRSAVVGFDSVELARDALITGAADLIFDDGISLSFWLLGTGSKACCAFKGGNFFEPRFFGDGVAITLNQGQADLKAQINAALKRLRESGRYDEVAGKSFPLRSN